MDPSRIIFIHGSDSSSQTYKATLLHGTFPGILTPDFTGDMPQRMAQLEAILGGETGWTLIGSSLGGLMAALFALRHPGQVKKLVLLAPALTLPEFPCHLPAPLSVPTVIVQGSRDEVIPAESSRQAAERAFSNLDYRLVDDDHRLHKTARELDWKALLT